MKRSLIIFLVSVILYGLIPGQTLAFTDDKEFVRTANYFLLSGKHLEGETRVQTLASFDLLVIPVEAQIYNKPFFTHARQLNPDIIILPYIATVSWNDLYWNDPLHQKLYKGITNDMWLKNGSGKQTSVWSNTRALNLNTKWKTHLAHFVKNSVLSSGLWDGVFYDEVQDSISWLGSVDVNKDGNNDSRSQADSLWAKNYKELFSITRSLLGDNEIIVINGSSNKEFAPYLNGRMFETFSSNNSKMSDWSEQAGEYLELEKDAGFEPINILNVNTGNTGNKNDYQKVRFGITTTLLGDGYFSFDHGTQSHAQTWTYDEFTAHLGAPKTSLHNTVNPQNGTLAASLLYRDFEQGKVLVNATNSTQQVLLDGEYEKIHGTQDPFVNDGSIISEVTLSPKDGIILLRPIEKITNSTFLNGSFARIFSKDGDTKRTGFFAYESSQHGGTQVNMFDLDLDGKLEMVVAGKTWVEIYDDNGDLHARFAPYTETYDQGINISVGDIESDGSIEIVTGTENGGGPQVRVFNQDGVLINPGFFAYAENFRGGVNVTIGDLNGDNIKEIVCGAGYTGGPHIRVFKKDGTLINPGFFAYDERFRGGVNVAAADVDGDGIDDIVTGPGLGGEPEARVYDKDGNLKSSFEVFDSTKRKGLEVAASDLDNDGIAEIIGLTTDVFTLSLF